MLRNLRDLQRYKVNASDGEIGDVVHFLFDDERWTIRYLVVQTGGPLFLNGRRVLISPISFRQADWSTRRFHLASTMDEVRDSPGVELDKPVSRQHERDYNRYYGYPYYWRASGLWGMGAYPSMLAVGQLEDAPAKDPRAAPGDVHLRSDEEVRGYHIEGRDGAIGHVEDLIVDDETWEVRYLVIDTRNWWFGKKVLVAPQWASRISWVEGKVYVDLSRQAIANSPRWNADAGIDGEYEARLHDHYGRPVHSGSGDRPEAAVPSQHDSESTPG